MSKLGFYNHFGFGDTFINREFVRQIMKYLGYEEAEYFHGKDFTFFPDFNIKEYPMRSDFSAMKKTHSTDDELFINTWIGRDSRFVLPGIACTIPMYIEMYHEMGFLIPRDYELYLPEVDYSKVYATRKNPFPLDEYILICNGDVQSNQSENFDFAPSIEILAKEFPNKLFMLTKRTNLKMDNVLYTEDFTGGKDLFDIGYLSENNCRLIVGRSSGPYVFCQTRNNYNNPEKRILSFTYTMEAAHAAQTEVKAKLYWSNQFHLATEIIRRLVCEL